MAKKTVNVDLYMQQKMNVLTKLRDDSIKDEKELQNLSAERMLKIPDVSIQDMQVIIDLQKSVRAGRLYSYLIEVPESLVPKCVNRMIEAGNSAENEGGDAYAG